MYNLHWWNIKVWIAQKTHVTEKQKGMQAQNGSTVEQSAAFVHIEQENVSENGEQIDDHVQCESV